VIALLWAAQALAMNCPDPFTVEEFRALVEEAERALDYDDVMAHGMTWTRMKENLPCLEEPLPKDDWARYLIGYAIVRHATGDAWRAPLRTALTIDPDIERDYGDDDIRLYPVPPEEEMRGLELAPGESFLLDGLVIPVAPPFLEGPHILQMAGSPYKTRLVIDRDFPMDWLAMPEIEPVEEPEPEPEPVAVPEVARTPGKGLLLTGAGLGALGLGAGIGTWVLATSEDNWTNETRFDTLTTVNAVGWTAAGLGGGLVAFHLVRGARISAGARSVHLSGRF
jgi:hypothetical protein